MGRVRTIARRSFLIGSVAVAGGVAFGISAVRAPFDNPNDADLAEGAVSFNPWVIVDKEKITLIAPHADKGQGVLSVQAALIAEELDVELDQVEISFGKPDGAYYNTAVANVAVPFLSFDQSRAAKAARTVAGGVIRGVSKYVFPIQGTGGSSTIPDVYEKLREAGAVARETLKAAAEQETGVPVAQMTTANGAVQMPDGREIPYTELAETASTLTPVKDVELRPESAWRYVGKPMQRVDIPAKSTGTLDYSIDFQMDGMLYAAIKVNPRQGGVLNGFDATVAQGMAGVEKVIEITGGIAVVARNTWAAFRAADAVDCDWGPAPYPAEQADHWDAVASAFNEDQLNANARTIGDVETASGDQVIAEYKSPYVAHAPLEPLGATMLVTDDGVQVWTGHQIQTYVASAVSEITGHDPEQVTLHNMYMGGSFGHRLEFDFLRQTAEIAKEFKGTPIKLTYSREEDFAHDFPRHITMGRGRGTVENGQVTSLDLQIAAPSVIGSQMSRMGLSVGGPDTQIHEGAWDNPYFNLPNLRVRSYKAADLAPVSSWRSVGAAPNGFIYDTFLDELIHVAGADPMEERIRLMGHDVSVKVLEAVADMSSWGGELAPNRARGVSFVISFGVPTAQVTEVENTKNGIKIHKVWMAADVGKVIDPVNLENMAQGGVVFGLGHAINCEITYADGMAQQTNYHAHEGMRMYQCPDIEFRALENAEQIRGFGEPPVPPTAPALGNAIFAATGERLREMPFNKFIDFV